MYNRVILIGRLTQDPELKYTQNGTAVTRFSLAVDRRFNREETDFINIVVWRGQAENCAKYLGKGRLAAVEGRLQVRSFEGQDGQRRWVTEVVADDVRFLDRAGASEGGGNAAAANRNRNNDEWASLGREVSLEDIDIAGSDDDDIPF